MSVFTALQDFASREFPKTAMAARSVSLVNRLELEFQGTIYKNAIAFGDVDGDGGNEALICNTTGQLFVFKGRSTKPRRTCQGLGCVTAILVGDARNDVSNVILTLNTEGQCFVFDPISVEEDEKVERTENVAKEKVQYQMILCWFIFF